MKKTSAIRTIDEKAAFIAENMKLTFDSVLDDFDINWIYDIVCKCYVVEDDTHGEVIYADYDEACSEYEDLVEELKDPLCNNVGAEVRLSEVEISGYYYIKSSELDTAALSDLFDKHKTTVKSIAIANITSNGIVVEVKSNGIVER